MNPDQDVYKHPYHSVQGNQNATLKCQPAPETTREIPNALAMVSRQIDSLAEHIGALEQRLTSVLEWPNAQTTSSFAGTAAKSASGGQLYEMSERIETLLYLVKSITDRAQV